MDQEHRTPQPEKSISKQGSQPEQTFETRGPTPLRTRILAGIGALLMLILAILYAYSIATGKIFAW